MNFFKKFFEKESDAPKEATKESCTLEDVLSQIAKQEIRLSYTKAEGALPVGSGKIGGEPDLPADFVWPEFEGINYSDNCKEVRPLAFLAQINLKDIAAYDREELLPKTGLLSFFYEVTSMPWGFDAADRGCAKVYYFPDTTTLQSTPLPKELEEEGILPECAVSFSAHISLPAYESFAELDVTKQLGDEVFEDWDVYDECCAEMGFEPDDMGDRAKLLGYPDLIQGPMEEECEMIARGHYTGDSEGYAKVSEEEKEDIKRKAKDWRLLFQMGTVSTEGYELMFGDCGYIYFWIRKEDLLARRFDRVWLILQCG